MATDKFTVQVTADGYYELKSTGQKREEVLEGYESPGNRNRNGYAPVDTSLPPPYEDVSDDEVSCTNSEPHIVIEQQQLLPPSATKSSLEEPVPSAPALIETGSCLEMTDIDLEGCIKVVICQVGQKNRDIQVPPDIDVVDLKRRYFEEAFTQGANIRIIHMGKMLADTDKLSDQGVVDDAHLHVMISNLKTNPANRQVDQTGGYDTDDQIEGDHDMAARLQEDADDDSEGTNGVWRARGPGREGTPAEFTLGFALGMLLGVIMLIWVFSRSSSPNYKRGILFGVVTNLIFQWNMSGMYDADDEDGEGEGDGQRGNDPWSSILGGNQWTQDGGAPSPETADH